MRRPGCSIMATRAKKLISATNWRRGRATWGTLRRGGWLVLDFLGAPFVREAVHAVAGQVMATANGARVMKHISVDGRFVFKDIELPSGARHQERVRLYEPAELARFFAAAGLQVRHLFGDYDGAPQLPESPRAIFLAQAA